MGIKLIDAHRFDLYDRLKKILIKHNCYSSGNTQNCFNTFMEVLEANSRWIEIDYETLEEISLNYKKKIPTGDFRTNFGRILVKRKDDKIEKEFYSENTVVKGWHKELIHHIKHTHHITCTREMCSELYELGQLFIMQQGNTK